MRLEMFGFEFMINVSVFSSSESPDPRICEIGRRELWISLSCGLKDVERPLTEDSPFGSDTDDITVVLDGLLDDDIVLEPAAWKKEDVVLVLVYDDIVFESSGIGDKNDESFVVVEYEIEELGFSGIADIFDELPEDVSPLDWSGGGSEIDGNALDWEINWLLIWDDDPGSLKNGLSGFCSDWEFDKSGCVGVILDGFAIALLSLFLYLSGKVTERAICAWFESTIFLLSTGVETVITFWGINEKFELSEYVLFDSMCFLFWYYLKFVQKIVNSKRLFFNFQDFKIWNEEIRGGNKYFKKTLYLNIYLFR